MALTADGDGLLVFGDINFGALALNFDFGDFGRREGFADVFGGVVAPVDDVDFFAITDFVHDSLDANTAATDEGADGINARHIGGNGNFGAAASFTGDGFDLHGAVFDLWDFLAEEVFDKFGIAAAKDELGAAIIAFDAFDEYLEAGADCVIFAFDLFGFGHDAGGFADVDADKLGFDTGDHTSHDGANLVLKHGEDDVAFSFAEALDDDLLGGLAGDATEAGDFVLFFDDVTDFLFLTSFLKGNFSGGIEGDIIFDDSAHDEGISFAGVEVEFGADIHVLVAVIFAPGSGNGLLDDI